ncbi:hypothetical protein TRICHSKD4_3046 [Roseibium sp. TrichSKD4]|uniref:SctD/MshK family protein n=1 Tax=Roseibium sp. TrichSKD4 TaxID=744980 RepID=UPI0001E56B24|nr:hypothetical protein [Roseibium sp. TrichSKD4]EFO31951.1 hypothetical protein TRICHSKD4_3046 [Roseibium sp. TrichSKD4]
MGGVDYILRVSGGVNDSAKIDLTSFPVTLGKGLDNDVVLSGLDEGRVTISLGKYGDLIVESKELDVKLFDGSSVKDRSEHAAIFPPETFYLTDDLAIIISPTKPVSRTRYNFESLLGKLPFGVPEKATNLVAEKCESLNSSLSFSPFKLLLLFPILALVILSFGDLFVQNKTGAEMEDQGLGQEKLELASTLSQQKIEMDLADSSAITCDGCLEEASSHLAKLIEDNEIAGISVHTEQGILEAKGEIINEQHGAWLNIQQNYDLTWGHKVPLEARVREVEMTAPFELRSVWLGKTPEFTTNEGAVFRKGDVTNDGWRVETIDASGVMLKRPSAVLKLSF